MAEKDCIIHPGAEAVAVCIIGQRGIVRDFCANCIEDGADQENFGRCYECADGLHQRCIGVPCQCPCPATSAELLDEEIAQAEAALAELKTRRGLLA